MAQELPLFVILDGNALLHRAWHALPPLTTRDGRVVHAAYGFAMVIEKLLETRKPAFMAVAWDLPGKTFRHEAYAAYKATREKKAPELYAQIPLIQDMLTLYGIRSVSAEGYEADDVIGTLSCLGKAEGMEVLIVTGDLDALQLVNERVRVLFFQKGLSNTKTYDEATVKERYGLTPYQLIDYKALRGDASDNIPGVAGIGEKTATELMQAYGSLEHIFEAIEKGEVVSKIASKLAPHHAHALESRRLVKIVCDVPLETDAAAYKLGERDRDALRRTFEDLEFKSLLKKYAAPAPDEMPASPKKERKASKPKAAVLRGVEALREQLRTLQASPAIGVLIGERRQDLFGSHAAFAALSNGTTTVVVPEPGEDHLAEICALLKTASLVVTHDLKRLWHLLSADPDRFATMDRQTNWYDAMLAGYLLETGNRSYDLPSLVHVHLDQALTLPAIGASLGEAEWQQLGAGAGALVHLYEPMRDALEREELWKLYTEVELPLVPILFRMESRGIEIDGTCLKEISHELEKRLASLTRDVHEKAGEEFNINSPSQLARILFEKLGLPRQGIKKTKTGLSTAASELEKLAGAHPIVELVGEYRELSKLQSTYVEVLPGLAGKDGRIHTTFHQTVAATGRLSSANPNLQNIPASDGWGSRIRKAFVAGKGKVLLAADYSQIELRLAAVIAQDQPFIETFREGADVHARTASEIWEIPEAEVTGDQRRAAKAINFGILYGMGARSLARAAGLPTGDAQAFIDRFFEVHHAIRTYLDETKIKARTLGYVETMFGRKRHVPELASNVPMLVAAGERMAINMPIQGTEADIVKMAMIQVDGWIRTLERGTKRPGAEKIALLLQVHDELVFEVDEAFASETARAIKHILETVVALDVPLTAEVEIGPTWGSMKEWKE